MISLTEHAKWKVAGQVFNLPARMLFCSTRDKNAVGPWRQTARSKAQSRWILDRWNWPTPDCLSCIRSMIAYKFLAHFHKLNWLDA